jgi:hypothetical protein
MTSKLTHSLDSLRAVVPGLNSASDEANRIVKQVERVLVDELGVGISARSSRYSETRRRGIDDENGAAIQERIVEYLAFGRVHGVYGIHRKQIAHHQGEFGILLDEAYSEETPWSQCDRETRLRLFNLLPELVENIVHRAQELAKQGHATAAKVKDLLEDEACAKPPGNSSVINPVTAASASPDPAGQDCPDPKKSSASAAKSRPERHGLKR